MKKVVILGSSGMAGHMIYKYLSSLNKYELGCVSRTKVDDIPSIILDIDEELYMLIDLLSEMKPDVIVNCIGILVKQSEAEKSRAIFINSLLPHLLEDLGNETGVRVIHLSTDCVFSGNRGDYLESDIPDGKSWYSRTKTLGEIVNNRDLNLRMSIIGPELKENGIGLFNWFMYQTGVVLGYKKCLWNGITTLELAKQIDCILNTSLTGIYHLVPEISITKYDLLYLMKDIFNKKDVNILEDFSSIKNHILLNSRQADYSPNISSYPILLQELKDFYFK